MQTLPGSVLELIETEFFFQLLVRLLADPSRLDGGRQGAQVGLRRRRLRLTLRRGRVSSISACSIAPNSRRGAVIWIERLALKPVAEFRGVVRVREA